MVLPCVDVYEKLLRKWDTKADLAMGGGKVIALIRFLVEEGLHNFLKFYKLEISR